MALKTLNNILILLILIVIIIIYKCLNYESFTNSTNSTFIWENKVSTIPNVINKLKEDWSLCGFNDFELLNSDLQVITSRKRLIELLPITKLLPKLTYNQIKCFVSKFDPENYLIINKTITNVPKILRPKNIIIVNNMLYQSTPYGVMKYKIPKYTNINESSLNASIEFGLLNDYNMYNFTNDTIFHIDGKAIQQRNNKFIDIKNNDEIELSNINQKIQLLNKKITKITENMVDVGGIIELNIDNPSKLQQIDPSTFLPVVPKNQTITQVVTLSDGKTITQDITLPPVDMSSLQNDNIISIIDYDGIIYIADPNSIKPLSNWASKVNNIITKNKFNIKAIIPQFIYTDNFNYSLIIVFNDNFGVVVTKNDVSDIIDINNLIGISFDPNIPDKLSCDDIKILLDQMINARVITSDRAQLILSNYRC